jgi:hypothetical protein
LNVPRYSDDTLVQRAREWALLDRESLLDAYSGEGPQADTIREEIAGLTAIKGKKLAKMTSNERHAAMLALLYASSGNNHWRTRSRAKRRKQDAGKM